LHQFPTCGDVDFYLRDEVLSPFVDVFKLASELQPIQRFACTAGGDFWCWKSLTNGLKLEPEILLIEPSLHRVAIYSPTFETFLYRTALEDASGRWGIASDELIERIVSMSDGLRKVGIVELADDLKEVAGLPITRFGPGSPPRLLDQNQCDFRIERYLGPAYLKPMHSLDFLVSPVSSS